MADIYADLDILGYSEIRKKYKIKKSMYMDAVSNDSVKLVNFLLTTIDPPSDVIHCAISNHKNETAKILLAHYPGWKYMVKTAMETDNIEVLQYMHNNAKTPLYVGRCWLENAAANGQLDLIRFCVENLTIKGIMSPYYIELTVKHTEISKLLIDHNIMRPANIVVQEAYSNGNKEIIDYVMNKYPMSDISRTVVYAFRKKRSDLDDLIRKLPKRAKIFSVMYNLTDVECVDLLTRVFKLKGMLGYSKETAFELIMKAKNGPAFDSFIFEYFKDSLSRLCNVYPKYATYLKSLK
jgi:hypothetical protein